MDAAVLELLVTAAVGGDRFALEQLVHRVSTPLYNLALKMLWHPADAEDATQEILIKVVTKLSSFRGQSQLMTWVYRIAMNHLLHERRKKASRVPVLSFEELGEELTRGLAEGGPPSHSDESASLLVQEIKVGCSLGMLRCLDAPSRAAYILGDLLELTGPEAASILGVTPEAFRQRLSRARSRLFAFMEDHCGIVQPRNACRCAKQVPHCLRTKKVDPSGLLFAHPSGPASLARSIDDAQTAVSLFRSHPEFSLAVGKLEEIRTVLAFVGTPRPRRRGPRSP